MNSHKLNVLAAAVIFICSFSYYAYAGEVADVEICFYSDVNYKGIRKCYFPDPRGSRANSYARPINYVYDAYNDVFSSVRVGRLVGAIIYSDANGGGASRWVIGDEPYLGHEWNDVISSLQVRVKSEYFDEVERRISDRLF